YSSGASAVAPTALAIVRYALLGASATIGVVYVVYNARRPNWRKLALLAIFAVATWYLYIALDDFQVGFAVWSAFHCIQYYGIVWAFSRNRAGLVRWLFQPRPSLVMLYLGLIFAYGGINYAAQTQAAGTAQQLLMAFVVTSGTLHYYYDGFI